MLDSEKKRAYCSSRIAKKIDDYVENLIEICIPLSLSLQIEKVEDKDKFTKDI